MKGASKSHHSQLVVQSADEWFTDYLNNRAYLANKETALRCDPACTRPCCKDAVMQIPVSIVDVVASSLRTNQSISANYFSNYTVGLFSCDYGHDRIRVVSLRLKKPCVFLQNDLCRVYSVRPLPCMLFPENLALDENFGSKFQDPQFKDYLCFERPLRLSLSRRRTLEKLERMWERERIISSFYLFDHGTCHIDFGNLMKELTEMARNSRKEKPGKESGHSIIISNEILERYFHEHIAECEPFASMNEKIERLDHREGRENFLKLLQNDKLYSAITRRKHGRSLVFRYTKGKLKAKWRSLIPIEYNFY